MAEERLLEKPQNKLQELILAMSLERQEAIARRTEELLTAWQAFEPAPLKPFATSAAALSWLALARDAVADIRLADDHPQDDLPQDDPLQDDPLQDDASPADPLDETPLHDAPMHDAASHEDPLAEDPLKGETMASEVSGTPSSEAIPFTADAAYAAQADRTPDAAPASDTAPAAAGDADRVTIDAESVVIASLTGGSADDEEAPAIDQAVPADVTVDAVAAPAHDQGSIAAFAEGIMFDDGDLPFPMVSPFEGDDASAALARAVSEGLALRIDHAPKARAKGGTNPSTVHPGSIPAYIGPPTSGTRLSSP